MGTTARMQMIVGFVDTYLELNRAEKAQFQQELKKETPRKQEQVMQIAGNWMKEGWTKGLTEGLVKGRREGAQKGLQTGLQKGRSEGQRDNAIEVTSRLLKRRFGELPVAQQRRLAKMSADKLNALSEASLDFQSIADLRAWLKDNG